MFQVFTEGDECIDGGSGKGLEVGKVQKNLTVGNQSTRKHSKIFTELTRGFVSTGYVFLEFDMRDDCCVRSDQEIEVPGFPIDNICYMIDCVASQSAYGFIKEVEHLENSMLTLRHF